MAFHPTWDWSPDCWWNPVLCNCSPYHCCVILPFDELRERDLGPGNDDIKKEFRLEGSEPEFG
jgi:hypothetical protein